MAASAQQTQTDSDPATELLELFYPVHYKGGLALEDVMRRGQLTRKQVAILWLIRSEGQESRRMRRKDIEQVIQTWFEVSSSAITKALRGMARPPLSLVQLVEDPQSGREKQILLTPKGERFLAAMMAEGREFLQRIVEQLSEEEVKSGIQFLRRSTTAFERARAEGAIRNGKKE
jgi:DNA-binding MarR family transcriptional regulator